jgi:hypothetical protein
MKIQHSFGVAIIALIGFNAIGKLEQLAIDYKKWRFKLHACNIFFLKGISKRIRYLSRREL